MSRACGAEHGIEKATRDIQHLLFAALRVLNDETQDGTTEEDRKLVIETLLECAQGAGEGLERSIKALWGVTPLADKPASMGSGASGESRSRRHRATGITNYRGAAAPRFATEAALWKRH